MKRTKQVCIRLPGYHLGIVESFREEKGLTFTDAVKEMILEYHKHHQNEDMITRFILRLEKIFANTSSLKSTDDNSSYEIMDELNEMSGNIRLILKILHVIGTSDVRTASEIEDILGELR